MRTQSIVLALTVGSLAGGCSTPANDASTSTGAASPPLDAAAPVADDGGASPAPSPDAGSAAPADGGATCASVDPVGPPGTYTPPSYTVACGTRDPFAWPFAKNSIWNIPIGANAVYVDANLGTMGACNVDNDLVYRESPSDPAHEVWRPDHMYGVDGMGGTGKYVHIPDAFTYPSGPNNGASFFDVDGHTIKDFSAFARLTGADPTGWDFGTNAIDGEGIAGGHAGSGMSVVGGTLRPGELTSAEPLHHALKVELDWAVLSPDWPGHFRWPAQNSDGYGNNTYSGTLKALTMGSLVALRPDLDLDSIAWQTPVGRKIAQAFQDYGAYVVDTTANGWKWNNGGYTMALCAQNEAISEVKAVFGIDWAASWGGGGAGWTADMQAIYERLAVVDDNSEGSPGGGGVPRRPLARDFVRAAADAGLLDSGVDDAKVGP